MFNLSPGPDLHLPLKQGRDTCAGSKYDVHTHTLLQFGYNYYYFFVIGVAFLCTIFITVGAVLFFF